MEEKVKDILNEVMNHEQGGLFGLCAKKCLDDGDDSQAITFIKELGEYTHIYNMRVVWGNELVEKIMKFCTEKGFQNPFINSRTKIFIENLKSNA